MPFIYRKQTTMNSEGDGTVDDYEVILMEKDEIAFLRTSQGRGMPRNVIAEDALQTYRYPIDPHLLRPYFIFKALELKNRTPGTASQGNGQGQATTDPTESFSAKENRLMEMIFSDFDVFKNIGEKSASHPTPQLDNILTTPPDFTYLVWQELVDGKREPKTSREALALLLDHFFPSTERSQKNEAAHASDPLPDDLVGLAFSGGGIRSATFGLGVVQRLEKIGLWKRVDYLSTVSGGGYLGSALSSWYASTPNATFPFQHTQGEMEPPPFLHLRNYARYLAPGGLIATLRLPSLFLRGVILSMLIIFPCFLLLAVIGDALQPLLRDGLSLLLSDLDDRFLWEAEWFPTTKSALFILTGILLVYGLFQTLFQTVWNNKELPDNDGSQEVPAPSSDDATDRGWQLRKIRDTFLVGLIGVVGLIFVLDAQEALVPVLAWFARDDAFGGVWPIILSILAIPPALMILRRKGFDDPMVKLALATALPLALWVSALYHYKLGMFHEFPLSLWAVLIVVCVLVWFILDGNRISLHGFYRDQLSKAYLIAPATDPKSATVAHNDNQRLSELNLHGKGPYHLINAVVNLSSSDDPVVKQRGRKADFFLFSRRAIGSRLTQYCHTQDMEKKWPELRLSSAMAISGAAFGPNMGIETRANLTFLMALLNLRLGYWLPNPNQIHNKKRLFRWVPAGIAMMREIFHQFNAKSRDINLSDGGHLENLGVFELLRRRCRLIIVVDGEQDPGWSESDAEHHQRRLYPGKFHLGGLATVIRLARIDLGINIWMNRLSRTMFHDGQIPFMVGRIRYDNQCEGILIYIKASLIPASMNQYILSYYTKDPKFPHQSTGDQFFDEEQFECYRALGYAVARMTFPNYPKS
jgi:hypothetical protein